MSADPHIADAVSTQGFNRYSYVDNNPLSATDPTGYFKWSKFRDKWLKPIVAVALAAYTGGLAASAYMSGAIAGTATTSVAALSGAVNSIITTTVVINGAVSGAITGAYGGYAQTGTLAGTLKGAVRGGVTGAFSAGASYSAGTIGNAPGRVLANATVGGVQSEMQGGNFADGFRKAAIINGLSESAHAMRRAVIADSQKNPLNASGDSVGFRGDGFKAGGGRCLEGGDCLTQSPSLLGGVQGGQGYLLGTGTYNRGDIRDYVVEAFGGPHDYLNSGFWYNSNGDAYNYTWSNNFGHKLFGETLNIANVLAATPFVAASVAQPYMNTVMQLGL